MNGSLPDANQFWREAKKVETPALQPGLYEQLLTLALQEDLNRLVDPRLYALAPVDSEDSHSTIAQFLEHVLANCLAMYRGGEAAENQKRVVDRIIA